MHVLVFTCFTLLTLRDKRIYGNNPYKNAYQWHHQMPKHKSGMNLKHAFMQKSTLKEQIKLHLQLQANIKKLSKGPELVTVAHFV